MCKESIKQVMGRFYAKMSVDKNGLGEIFNNTSGKSDIEWEAHKKKSANFWQGMLIGRGDYKGQPLKVHLDLPPFPREFFSLWLSLFEECLNKIFSPKIANEILQKAQMIAERFQYMLYESGH